MDNEVMIAVLNEVLADQKITTQKLEGMEKSIAVLKDLNEKLSVKLESFEIKIPPVDLRPMEILITKNAEEIKKQIAELPRNITVVKRFQLFPEHNPKEYYDAVFRWILYLVITLLAYRLSSDLIGNFKMH